MSTPANGHSNPNLAIAVREMLWQYTPLRVSGQEVQVDARDSTVILSGAVRSRTVKATAEQLAWKVKGVGAVENQLIVDDDLEIAVAQTLASDARTRAGFPGILVGVVYGVAYLKGTVASAEIKNAAGEIARRVPGVTRVSNELVAPAAPTKPAPAKAA